MYEPSEIVLQSSLIIYCALANAQFVFMSASYAFWLLIGVLSCKRHYLQLSVK